MTTPIPPIGPDRGGPPAVPRIRALTPVEREQQRREREQRRERARPRTDPEPPSEGVDVRA